MPNKKAAIKSLRQDKKKNLRNKAVLSELRTLTKSTKMVLAKNNREEADGLLKKLESKLTKAAQRDIIKKNSASRRISRLRTQWSKISTK